MINDSSFTNIKELVSHLHALINRRIWLKILLALVFGVIVGLILSNQKDSLSPTLFATITSWIGFPGRLFLALIQMIVVPLVFVSVVIGVSSSQSMEQLKKMGIRIGIYFICTTVIAVSIGFIVANIVKPGHEIYLEKKNIASVVEKVPAESKLNPKVPIEKLPDTLINILPQNPMTAITEGQMLQIVLFAIIIGFAILSIPSNQTELLLGLLRSIQEICMAVVKWSMYLAPLAVFGLLAEATAKAGIKAFLGLTGYVSSVLLGLLIVLIFYLFLVYFVGRMKPLEFLKKIRQVQMLAFSTSSSAAVMPLTLQTAEKELKLNPSVSQFIIPLGTTINMDGTALYQGVATIFLAHSAGIDLDLGGLLLVVVTAVGASIGSPGTPGVGIVILTGLLVNLGVPTEGIALILGVDRILDMCRTVINVTGDLTASVVMDRWSRKS
ncbi:MAG: dicarboxylate/amino acid:cation symporter [Bdellovibrionales bacterium]|nr:dicarboxylate/amino acid:cation symporter [Bdellovibrionales bacterium]